MKIIIFGILFALAVIWGSHYLMLHGSIEWFCTNNYRHMVSFPLALTDIGLIAGDIFVCVYLLCEKKK